MNSQYAAGEGEIQFKNIVIYHDGGVAKEILEGLRSGAYEKKEIEHAVANVTDSDVVLELGGGIGVVSCIILKNSSPKNYICVEANPHMFELIKRNHALNGVTNCVAVNGVLTHGKEEFFDFYVCDNFHSSSLVPQKEYKEIIKVKAFSFNEFIKNYQPSFLICDIEGGEYDILCDEADLSSVKKICLEVHNVAGKSMRELFNFLFSQGFWLKTSKLKKGVHYFERKPAFKKHPLKSTFIFIKTAYQHLRAVIRNY